MRRHDNRGSVTVLVIAVLATLMLIGVVFIMSAWADRKNTAAFTAAAPLRPVAQDVLGQLQRELRRDLYLGANGPFSSVPGSNAWASRVDAADEGADLWLGSANYVAQGSLDPLGRPLVNWPHATNLTGSSNPAFQNVGSTAAGFVDTDGDRIPDARLRASGTFDPSGRELYYAVRVIDTSALLNMNTGYRFNPDMSSSDFTPYGTPSRADLSPIIRRYIDFGSDDPREIRAAGDITDDLHAVRCGLGYTDPLVPLASFDDQLAFILGSPKTGGRPLDVTEELGLRWLGTAPRVHANRLERLYLDALGAVGLSGAAAQAGYAGTQPLFTVWNVDRLLERNASAGALRDRVPSPRLGGGETPSASDDDVAQRIYNAALVLAAVLEPTDPDAQRDIAAHFAVNAITYQRSLSDPRHTITLGQRTYYGLRPQPVITEAFVTAERPSELIDQAEAEAIELYNPPANAAVHLEALTLGGANLPVFVLNPGERVVLYRTDSGYSNPGGFAGSIVGQKIEWDALDLSNASLLADADGVPLDEIGPADFEGGYPALSGLPGDTIASRSCQRCDDPARELYYAAVYRRLNDGSETLGEPNGVDPASLAVPQLHAIPVRVRGESMFHVGELSSVYITGPYVENGVSFVPFTKAVLASADTAWRGRAALYPLLPAGPQQIAAGGWDGGNLPAVPWAALLLEKFSILRGDPSAPQETLEGNLYGRINVNTASREALWALPILMAAYKTTGPSTGVTYSEPLLQRDPAAAAVTSVGALPAWLQTLDGQKWLLVEFLLAYRDMRQVRNPQNQAIQNGWTEPIDYSNRETATGIRNLRPDAGRYYLTAAEIAIPIANWYNYVVFGNQWGLDPAGAAPNPMQPLMGTEAAGWRSTSTRDYFYTQISNLISVRSDTFVAYVRVQVGNGHDNPGSHERPQSVRHYIAIIDRSNCRQAGELPLVRAFAEIK